MTAAQIATAIKGFVDQQMTTGYRLLVVYFSGHGYWKNEGDLWLLSQAPDDADEAVSFLECADGSPRTRASECRLDFQCVPFDTGGQGRQPRSRQHRLPNRNAPPGKRSKVDRLMASREGTAAFEAKIGPRALRERLHPLLSQSLRQARPPDGDGDRDRRRNPPRGHEPPARAISIDEDVLDEIRGTKLDRGAVQVAAWPAAGAATAAAGGGVGEGCAGGASMSDDVTDMLDAIRRSAPRSDVSAPDFPGRRRPRLHSRRRPTPHNTQGNRRALIVGQVAPPKPVDLDPQQVAAWSMRVAHISML